MVSVQLACGTMGVASSHWMKIIRGRGVESVGWREGDERKVVFMMLSWFGLLVMLRRMMLPGSDWACVQSVNDTLEKIMVHSSEMFS